MNVFYVFEEQEVGPPLRIPMQFASEEEAQKWVDRRISLPAYADVKYEIRADNPQSDAKAEKEFNDA